MILTGFQQSERLALEARQAAAAEAQIPPLNPEFPFARLALDPVSAGIPAEPTPNPEETNL